MQADGSREGTERGAKVSIASRYMVEDHESSSGPMQNASPGIEIHA